MTAANARASSSSFAARHDALDRPESVGLGRRDAAAGEEGRAHLVQRQHAREVRRAAHGAAIDLRQGEVGILRGDDDVARAADADAAADHEARARRVTTGTSQPRTARKVRKLPRFSSTMRSRVLLHLLDVDAGAEALALGAHQQAAHLGVGAQSADDVGQLVPARCCRAH